MLTASVRPPEIGFKLAVPLIRGWRVLMEQLRGPQVLRRDHLVAGCFGKLTDKDEMVVRGLAARLTCATERGEGPS